jgi:hypothetical protein
MTQITYEQFSASCEKKQCRRKTMMSKNCSTESKRKSCYKKFLAQQEKNYNKPVKKKEIKVDHRWEKVREECWKRDYPVVIFDGVPAKGVDYNWRSICRYWVTRTEKEKIILSDKYEDQLWLNQHLDVCHIKQRSKSPADKYNLENVVLMGRVWHKIFDEYTDPLTGDKLTPEEREDAMRLLVRKVDISS